MKETEYLKDRITQCLPCGKIIACLLFHVSQTVALWIWLSIHWIALKSSLIPSNEDGDFGRCVNWGVLFNFRRDWLDTNWLPAARRHMWFAEVLRRGALCPGRARGRVSTLSWRIHWGWSQLWWCGWGTAGIQGLPKAALPFVWPDFLIGYENEMAG